MESVNIILRLSLYDGISRWIAQGLEFDIATDGDNPKEALERFVDALACECAFAEQQKIRLEERIPKAPTDIWNLYEKEGKIPVSLPKEIPYASLPIMHPCLVG